VPVEAPLLEHERHNLPVKLNTFLALHSFALLFKVFKDRQKTLVKAYDIKSIFGTDSLINKGLSLDYLAHHEC